VGREMIFTGLTKGFMVKLIGVCVILTLFGSCITVPITPGNRSEAFSTLKRLGRISITSIPQEDAGGPVFSMVSTYGLRHLLMAAGQTGLELEYKYFFIIASYPSAITVVYTNDENKTAYYLYNTSECSSFLDGYTIYY
jgi:hypothetical protein